MQQLAIDISEANPTPPAQLKQENGSNFSYRDHHKASLSIYGSTLSSNGSASRFETDSRLETDGLFGQGQQACAEKGSLTTVSVSHEGAIQPVHLLPMLARCSHRDRWLMWLSPYRSLNKEWLASLGIEDAPIVHIDLCSDTQMVLCEKVLVSGNSHMIIEWQGDLNVGNATRLRSLAEGSGSHVILIQRQA